MAYTCFMKLKVAMLPLGNYQYGRYLHGHFRQWKRMENGKTYQNMYVPLKKKERKKISLCVWKSLPRLLRCYQETHQKEVLYIWLQLLNYWSIVILVQMKYLTVQVVVFPDFAPHTSFCTSPLPTSAPEDKDFLVQDNMHLSKKMDC